MYLTNLQRRLLLEAINTAIPHWRNDLTNQQRASLSCKQPDAVAEYKQNAIEIASCIKQAMELYSHIERGLHQ